MVATRAEAIVRAREAGLGEPAERRSAPIPDGAGTPTP
jgi:hypothetical protein